MAGNKNTVTATNGDAFGFLRDPVERRIVIKGFFLLFFVLGGYFAVRPVRETIGTIIGRAATQDLWIFTAIFALVIVPLYGWLVSHVRRSILVPLIYAFMVAGFVVTALIFQTHTEGAAFAKIFYVWISVMNIMLVSVFWSFMLEIVSSEQAKRLFGPIFAGGTAGAFLGPLVTGRIVLEVGNVGVLYLGAAMFAVAIVLQRMLTAEWRRMTPDAKEALAPTERDRALGGNPFAGFALVFRSRYLTGIALFIVGISAINTFLYFEQLQLVEEQFEEIAKRTQVFANLDAIVQGLVIVTQLFLTGLIATRFGVTVLLVLVPIVMVFGLTIYAVSGTFIVMAAAMIVRRWGEYAFIRPGREMLFSKVDKESKYKAKNLCDVAVYRVADAGFAQVKKVLDALNMGATAQALVAAGAAVLWAFNGWWLGRRHDRNKVD
jgi:AAA family ATP:ADP antiporter